MYGVSYATEWIPKSFCEVNTHLFFHTHKSEGKLARPSMQIFSDRKLLWVRLFIENESTSIVIGF